MVACFSRLSSVRIVSWNCFGAAQSARAFLLREGAPDPHRFRHPDVAAALTDADVVCLQELWVRDAVALFDRLPHAHKAMDANHTEWWPLTIGGSGLGIASRHAFLDHSVRAFSRPHAGAERFARKGMLHARVDVRGTPVDLVTTHFQSGTSSASQRVRARQARELASFVREIGDASRALVVCGDFNVDGLRAARSAEYTVLKDALAGLEDLGAEVDAPTYHPHPEHNLLAHRFDRGAPAQRLDYVFFRPPTKGGISAHAFRRSLDALIDRGTRETHPSDHFALVVDLTLAPTS
jgi:endonuclease/exonuclease/phosphatase family metal-dependent hydrolase